VGVLSFAASPDDEGDEAFRMTPVVNGTPLTVVIAPVRKRKASGRQATTTE
jgi:hypothetical protein